MNGIAVQVVWGTIEVTKWEATMRPAGTWAKPGRSNKGHTFGDDLTEEERMAVIEYLKTL